MYEIFSHTWKSYDISYLLSQENQKEPKYDSHNRLRSPMPERGEPLWEVWRLKEIFSHTWKSYDISYLLSTRRR
jgi:hypothetical protein